MKLYLIIYTKPNIGPEDYPTIYADTINEGGTLYAFTEDKDLRDEFLSTHNKYFKSVEISIDKDMLESYITENYDDYLQVTTFFTKEFKNGFERAGVIQLLTCSREADMINQFADYGMESFIINPLTSSLLYEIMEYRIFNDDIMRILEEVLLLSDILSDNYYNSERSDVFPSEVAGIIYDQLQIYIKLSKDLLKGG